MKFNFAAALSLLFALSAQAVTINRAAIVNSRGALDSSTTTSTQLGFINSLSSNAQTQLDSKESALTFSSPLTRSTNTIGCQASSGSQAGCLSSSDWTTFNAKESTLTFNAPLSRSTNTISCLAASGSQAGCLGSSDFTTFNDKLSSSLASARIFVGNGSGVATGVGVTGDVTISNAGVTAIGSGKVTNAMLAGSIDSSKLVGTDIATVGTITSGTWSGTAIAETKGGTNQTSYATGDMLYASASNTLSKLTLGTANAGKSLQVGPTGIPTVVDLYDPSHVVLFYDDFVQGGPNSNGMGVWTGRLSGAGAASVSSSIAGNANPGLELCDMGTTNAGYCTFYSDARNSTRIGGGVQTYETILKLNALSNGTDTYKCWVGITTEMSAGPATPTNGIYFTYSSTEASGNWQINSTAASSTTTVDTGQAASTNFVRLGWTSNSAGTSYQAQVNGSNAGTAITTNIPTAGMNFQFGCKKSAGTAETWAYWDSVKYINVLAVSR